MIDLDEIAEISPPSFEEELSQYSRHSELYILCAVWLVQGKVTYEALQKITKWLGCYHYVLPHERDIYPDLSDWIYRKNRYNLFNLAILVSHLMANLTMEQQFLLLERLERENHV